MGKKRDAQNLTGMAGFLRDYRGYWQAAERWGEDTAAVIMQEAHKDRVSVQQVQDTFRLVRAHIRQGVDASEGFEFAASLARGGAIAIERAVASHSRGRVKV